MNKIFQEDIWTLEGVPLKTDSVINTGDLEIFFPPFSDQREVSDGNLKVSIRQIKGTHDNFTQGPNSTTSSW